MTDKETLTQMLDRAEVEWTTVEAEVEHDFDGTPGDVIVQAKKGPNNIGYTDFVAIFSFDGVGRLTTVGVWE